MKTLHNAKASKKAYRVWYKLNSNTVITGKTPVGSTDSEEGHELVAQGWGGAALASQLDKGNGVQCYFGNSTDEAKYGSVRIQQQCCQDDALRVAPNVESAFAENVK